ncbi:MAG: hypothetical protein AB7K68_11980 [Bacteriovoracia bacterium]
MSIRYLLVASFLLLPAAHGAGSCPALSLATLKNSKASPGLRSQAGICLMEGQLEKNEVARAVLHIIRDPKEDLFLREDLIEAFAKAPLRRTVQVEGVNAPSMNQEEKENLDRTLSSRSASSLMAIAQAVKSMDEIVPVTRLEGDFFRALSEIAQEDTNHVLLRETAVVALEKLSQRTVESGLFEEKTIRMAQETLRVIAARDDVASYYSGAAQSYGRLASAGLPGFEGDPTKPTANRMISSVPGKR